MVFIKWDRYAWEKEVMPSVAMTPVFTLWTIRVNKRPRVARVCRGAVGVTCVFASVGGSELAKKLDRRVRTKICDTICLFNG